MKKRRDNPIRGVLNGQLAIVRQKIAGYRGEMLALPRGSLVEKVIRGRSFYYLAYRQNGRVKSAYKGKMSIEDRAQYADAMKRRARLREIISDLRSQEAYLVRVLHERKRRAG
jgi:hypothetical protein